MKLCRTFTPKDARKGELSRQTVTSDFVSIKAWRLLEVILF
jgi:hypothetical protein